MLALIAGQGRLPEHVLTHLSDPPLIAALERFPPDTVTPDVTFRIETLGSFLAVLKDKGVRDVVFAGSLSRVPIDPSAIDAATQPLVPRMVAALQAGDDAALRTVLAFFEEAGFVVRAAHELAPDLLPKDGPLGALDPDHDITREIARAEAALAAMGQADIGQACVVKGGQVLAIEGTFGTDWMLSSLADRPDEGGGILYKAPKPKQDHRIDLPTIGPDTVAHAKAAGLSGIVIKAGGVQVLDRARLIKAADAAGVFVMVHKSGL